ncbi:MAG: hypothetical protein FWF72_04840 [Paludibacter sp.]|nr:hypothetical protein [Paludibacter sp.]
MNKIFGNKYNLTTFCVLIMLVFYSNIIKAQSDWIDCTIYYYYSILDENGKEISFKDNADYSIMIDSVLYKLPYIPQDSLQQFFVKYSRNQIPFKECQNQIRINDFSIAAIPQIN